MDKIDNSDLNELLQKAIEITRKRLYLDTVDDEKYLKGIAYNTGIQYEKRIYKKGK